MITYKIEPFAGPITVCNGDEIRLHVHGELVHAKPITCCGVMTHWAYIDIPEIGCSYFIGNEQLEAFIIERFPDAERV